MGSIAAICIAERSVSSVHLPIIGAVRNFGVTSRLLAAGMVTNTLTCAVLSVMILGVMATSPPCTPMTVRCSNARCRTTAMSAPGTIAFRAAR